MFVNPLCTVYLENERKSEEKLIDQAWEHCMRSECLQGSQVLETLSDQTWETELLRLCLEGMILYQAQKFEDSYRTFEGILAHYPKHSGIWTDLEKFKMDWVIKQFGETAYKINSDSYRDLSKKLASISEVFSSPIALADQAQRLLNFGKLAEAEQKCEESLRLLETNRYPGGLSDICKADMINILVAVKHFLGKFEEAKELIKKTSELNLDVRLQVNLLRKQAEAALFQNDFAQASMHLIQCQKILEDSSDVPLKFTTFVRLAIYYQRNNQFNEAVDIYQKVISLKEGVLSSQEKANLQWNVGIMIHRMRQQSVNSFDALEKLTDDLDGKEDLLIWSYALINNNLLECLLKPTYEEILESNAEREPSEIVAYVPYGYDVFQPI
jgi:tetratricopeptide (TPR) repeat protein